ncbi:MAG: hypothetical protein ACYCZJ_12795 [Sulfuriferula sp.]
MKILAIAAISLTAILGGCKEAPRPTAPVAPLISEHDQKMFCLLADAATVNMALEMAMRAAYGSGWDGGEKAEMEKLSQTDGTILENVKAQANMATFYVNVHHEPGAASRGEEVCNEVMNTARKYGYDSPKVAIVAKKYYYPKKW